MVTTPPTWFRWRTSLLRLAQLVLPLHRIIRRSVPIHNSARYQSLDRARVGHVGCTSGKPSAYSHTGNGSACCDSLFAHCLQLSAEEIVNTRRPIAVLCVDLDMRLKVSLGTSGSSVPVFFDLEAANAGILIEACYTQPIMIRLVEKYWMVLHVGLVVLWVRLFVAGQEFAVGTGPIESSLDDGEA